MAETLGRLDELCTRPGNQLGPSQARPAGRMAGLRRALVPVTEEARVELTAGAVQVTVRGGRDTGAHV
jgi:hypothetical protein